MYTRSDYSSNIGQWAQFRTPWGTHRGIISGVNNQAVLVRVPRQYAPSGLMSYSGTEADDEKRLDLALVGYGGYGPYGGGYGPYGGRWGAPGYGAWGGGWWWWWLAFAWIFALAFLW